ncbi:hypothetical protein, partial [Photobacterium sanguinicancri]
MDKPILIVFGRGGHESQAKRFIATLSEDVKYIILTDSSTFTDIDAVDIIRVPELRDKAATSLLSMSKNALNIFNSTRGILSKNELSGMISTGPGVSIFSSI